MNTRDIERVLKSDASASKSFQGVFAMDEFARCSKTSGAYIVNTHVSSLPGEHWLCLILDQQKGEYEFFDFYGRQPGEFPTLWKTLSPLLLSSFNPGVTSTVCGDYCVYFCLMKSRGWRLVEIVSVLLFSSMTEMRDHAIRKMTLNRFGNNAVSSIASLTGVDGVHAQIARPFLEF